MIHTSMLRDHKNTLRLWGFGDSGVQRSIE